MPNHKNSIPSQAPSPVKPEDELSAISTLNQLKTQSKKQEQSTGTYVFDGFTLRKCPQSENLPASVLGKRERALRFTLTSTNGKTTLVNKAVADLRGEASLVTKKIKQG